MGSTSDNPQHKPDAGRTAPVTEEELKQLPRWAIVAFAARCARRVQPLYVKHNPDAMPNHVQAIDKAITLAEATASGGVATDMELRDAIRVALAAANAAYVPNAPAADVAYTAAHAAAALAANAANAALVSNAAAFAAANAAANAANVANVAAFAYAARADYDLLLELAKRLHWTDASPVDVGLLGPLWPVGMEPEWAKVPKKPDDPAGFTIEFEFPDDVDDDKAEQLILEYFKHLNEFNRAIGGSGLRISPPIEVSQPCRTGSGVLS
jgi:hypothetical protein